MKAVLSVLVVLAVVSFAAACMPPFNSLDRTLSVFINLVDYLRQTCEASVKPFAALLFFASPLPPIRLVNGYRK